MLTDNPVFETVHNLHASNIKDASVYHIGTIVENIETLQQYVFNQLPGKTIHVYTHSKALIEQLQALEMENKTIIPHWVEPVYPEQWLFHLSKKIAEKRIDESTKYIEGILQFKAIPDSSQFKKLAIRRLSLSRLYIELSIFFSVLNQVQPDSDNPLLFLSNHFEHQDLVAHNKLQGQEAFISILPVPIKLSRIREKTHFSKWKITLTERLAFLKQNRTEKQKHSFEYIWLSRFLKIENDYQSGRDQFPYAQLRQVEIGFRKARISLRIWLKTLQLVLLSQKKTWVATISNLKAKDYFKLSLGFMKPTKDVLFLNTNLTKNNMGYILKVVRPIYNRLSENGSPVVFLLNNEDKNFCRSFENSLFKTSSQNSVLIQAQRFPAALSIAERLFVRNDRDITKLCLPDETLQSQYVMLENTLLSITRLKSLLGLFYYYAKRFSFDLIIGMEEDIETISLLNILKPLLKQKYQSFVIPSCLPEYSECYDCVDVDDLSVSMDFVKEIFTDQNLNAKRIHIVGSLEWEEKPVDQDFQLPNSIQSMIQTSAFTLGVLHQPIFVTMHGQTIYNQLSMNFLDIYQRFLEKHPNACILIKPHPRDNIEQLKAYLGPLERIQILPVETPTSLFYNAIDVAISMHSTMVTHTMAHGIPVLSMYQYPDYHRMYDYIRETGCLATDSHDEALAWLDKMQNNPAFFEDVKTKMAYLKEQYLSTPASEKIMQLLESNSH